MLNRVVMTKIEWGDYHQGEQLDPTFDGGNQYERYNFRRADGDGSVTRTVVVDNIGMALAAST
jgi:hypothetical protein